MPVPGMGVPGSQACVHLLAVPFSNALKASPDGVSAYSMLVSQSISFLVDNLHVHLHHLAEGLIQSNLHIQRTLGLRA